MSQLWTGKHYTINSEGKRFNASSVMCKWTRPFWGTDCRRAPKSLFSAQTAPLSSAGIERAQKCLQGQHVVRCCHSAHGLLFRDSAGVTRGGQQQFASISMAFARYRLAFRGLDVGPSKCPCVWKGATGLVRLSVAV